MKESKKATLEHEYEETRAQIVAAEARLGKMSKAAPERKQAIAAKDALVDRARVLKEAINNENKRWTFAGLGTPLHQVLLMYIKDEALLDKMETAALEILAEREKLGAERKAAKAAKEAGASPATTSAKASTSTMTTVTPAATSGPEVIRVRPATAPTATIEAQPEVRASSPRTLAKPRREDVQRAAIERLRARSAGHAR